MSGAESEHRTPSEPEGSTVQLLLCMCDIMGVTRDERYLALWLFADQLIPSLQGGQLNKLDQLSECQNLQQPPLQLFAVACLLLALQQQPLGDESANCQQRVSLQPYHPRVCKALGQPLSLDKLASAVKVVKGNVALSEQQLTSHHLTKMHAVISHAGLAVFEPVKLDICYAILDLLYASEGFRASKPLESGGKLLAAAIIGAAFAIAVRPDKVVSLPLLSWLCDLSAYPKEVVRTQAEQILTYVLQ